MKYCDDCGEVDEAKLFKIVRNNKLIISSICYTCREIKRKNTMLKTYGVPHNSHFPDYLEKRKATWVKNYGTDHPMHSKAIKDQMRNKSIATYGTDHPMQNKCVQDKYKKAILDLYGVDNVSQVKTIKDKAEISRVETCRSYGVENVMHISNVFRKSQQTLSHDYVLPSGLTVKVRGNESKIINYLLNLVNEEDIVFSSMSDIPEIWYTENNIRHRYYPDFYIPKLNWFIEALTNSYTQNGLSYSTKRNACLDLGFKFNFAWYNKKDNNVILS